jgi:two-component sensor histidine kinase
MNAFFEVLRAFFTTEALSPHGICLLWRPELIWTHAIADLLIGLAYFSIPLALGVFLYHRRDVRFSWAVWMFVAFIMLCGVTHFLMVATLWLPIYGVEALVKAATAFASILTAIALWPLLPRAIAIPSSNVLQARIAERDAAVAELKAAMATMVEMREHEQRQKLLLDELNHRVKNTLATVQSIAVQTLNRADDMEAFRDTFVSRLMALSSTHNLLVRHEWSGASLRELAEETLGHYDRPYAFAGEDLLMDANVAVSLGMALHELATNALKYGAWAGAGRVDLEVRAADDHASVEIIWRESGGRAVAPPPSRGFGSRLLERGVAGELGGSVTLDFAPGGLLCRIRAPLSPRLRLA